MLEEHLCISAVTFQWVGDETPTVRYYVKFNERRDWKGNASRLKNK